MEREDIYYGIRNRLFWKNNIPGFRTEAIDAGDGNTTLANMGVLNYEDIDVVLNIIEDNYDVWLEDITPETTFDQLVDAVLALLE